MIGTLERVLIMKLKEKLFKFGMLISTFAFRFLMEPLGLFQIYKRKSAGEEPVGSPPAPASVIIDASITKGEIHPFIYGTFIEELGRCIHGGIWDEYNKKIPLINGGIRKDVVNSTRLLNTPIIRWPGGCFSDAYSWKNGIGPRNERKKNKNPYWHWFGPKIGPVDDNHFGSDEFMLFIKEVGSEALINVNFGSGTLEEAAAWVEYMNGSENSEWGSKRANNGHPTPYCVKYWGIANEIYGMHELGHCSAEEYAHRYVQFAKAMRTIDPSIKLMACGIGFEQPLWNRTLLEIAADYIDYLSIHLYIPGIGLGSLSNSVQDFYNIIAGAFEMERRLEWVEKSIEEILGEDHMISIALDEWGPWWNVRQLYEGYYTLRDGLFAASVFEMLHRHTSTVKMANYAQLVNTLAMMVTNDRDLYHNPIYLAFQLFSNHAEKFVVLCSVNCATHQTPKFGIISPTDIPYLGCSATIDENREKLVIIGINRHHAHPLETAIEIENFDPGSTALIYELNGPSHSTYNDFDQKDEVNIQEFKFNSVSNQFTYRFPPHSVSVLIIQKQE